MRFHTLSLEGIGSFHDRTVLDFDRLSKFGVFLIHGKTGAGKSTLLDALVFALYGHVAGHGEQSSDQRLLSFYWDKDYSPSVELVFASQGQYFRLHRTVEFTKPGNKNPTPQKALLEQDDNLEFLHPTEIAAGVSQVNSKVRAVLGLEEKHFLQTVLLPQGKVQEFLTSEASRRFEVLRELFGAQRFTRLEQAARDKVLAFEQVDAKHSQMQCARIESLGNLLGSNELLEDRGAELKRIVKDAGRSSLVLQQTVSPILDEATSLLAEHLRTSQTAADRASAEANEAQEALRLAQREAEIIAEASKWTSQLEAMEAEKPQFKALEEANKTAHKAAEVLQAWENLEPTRRRAKHKLDDVFLLVHQVDTYKEHLPDFHPNTNFFEQTDLDYWLQDPKPTELLSSFARDLQQSTQAMAATLKKVAEYLHDASNTNRSLEAKTAAIVAGKDQLRSVETKISSTKTKLEQAEGKLKDATSLADKIPHLEEKFAQSRTLVEKSLNLEKLVETVKESEAHLASLQQNLEKAKADEESALAAWIRADAPRLAAHLVSGEPCPVCGSLTHPHPASSEGGGATLEEYESRRESRAKLDAAVSGLREEVAGLQAEAGTAKENLGGKTIDEVQTLHEANGKALREAQQAKKDATELANTLKECSSELESLSSTREEVALKVSATEAEAALLRKSAAQLEKKIRLALNDPDGKLEANSLLEANNQLLQLAKSLEDGVQDWLLVREQWHGLQDAFQKSLHKFGYETIKDAQLDAKTLQDLQTDEKRVEDFWQTFQNLRAKLETPLYANKANNTPPDLEELTEVARLHSETAKQLLERSTSLKTLLESARGQVASFNEAEEQWKKESVQFAPMKELADKLTGTNRLKSTLTSFFLGKRLDQVLEVANQRITDISRGYYQIRHIETDVDSRDKKYHGLGIGMYNAAKDETIPPRSLSGGEKFYCALAIALALSEVVQAERGAITLENIFIDEGFGSLDNTTRNLVMETLRSLGRGGRSVGIISHVGELMEEIEAKVEVTNDRSGHTTGGKRIGSRLAYWDDLSV